MQSVETITVDTPSVRCDGGGPLGHPRVTLSLEKDDQAVCPYCGRRYHLREGARTGTHGH